MCFFVGIQENESLLDKSFTLRTDDGNLVLAKAVGEVNLYFDEFRMIILRDCFYVPNFKRNLILVTCLFKDSYTTTKKGFREG